jgi:branched-chain amino acid aminotransferase
MMSMEIKIEEIPSSELKPKHESEDDLGFGEIFTDRMFKIEYNNGSWNNPIITKYSPICLKPAAVCFHYGQTIFEGQKAYKAKNGHINLFRPDRNIERFNRSAIRMMMPEINPEIYLEGLKSLLILEKEWIPNKIGSSLYIRPTMIATQPILGLHPSTDYLFYIILSPSGPYFSKGFDCIKIFVSDSYIRAAPGGTGYAKTGGNYAASLLIGEKAYELGYDQVLWLDAVNKQYMEEVGAANFFCVYQDEIFTASLDSGTVLAGITRESVIQIARDFGYTVREEALTISQIIEGITKGDISECFGTGTAAIITPIGLLCYKKKDYVINNSKLGKITKKLYDQLINIQYGIINDPYGWIVQVD